MKNIGIIGAENSHTVTIATEINKKHHAPGFAVTHVWGERPELAQKAARKGEIPTIVNDPTEMIGSIDAVICDHRHPKFHLDAVRPFIEARIPAFVDKPFCYRSDRGREFLEHARTLGVPVTSFSIRSYQQSFETFRSELSSLGTVTAGTTYGPCDLQSPYGGVFFYGMHQVGMALRAFGSDVTSVRVCSETPGFAAGHLYYADGKIVTLNLVTKGFTGFAISAGGTDGYAHKTLIGDENPHLVGVKMFTRMFETGVEPIAHDEILRPIMVLEALEQAIESDGAVRVATR